MDIYEKIYGIVKEEINGADYFAATTDMWSSRTMDPYMSFTVHWITEDMKLHKRSLQVLIASTHVHLTFGSNTSSVMMVYIM